MKFSVFFLMIMAAVGLNSGQAAQFTFSNCLPQVKHTDGQITIQIDSLEKSHQFYLYYRTEGLKNFQVRKMKQTENGQIYYQLTTDHLYGKKLEYFVMENSQKSDSSLTPVFTIQEFTDQESPEIYFLEEDTLAAESAQPKDPLIHINGSASSVNHVYDNSETADQTNADNHNGNLRVFKNIYKDNYQFDFDTNFAYMNPTMDTESEFNLSTMMVRFQKGSHKIEVGDLNIFHNNFATGSISKRGVNYELSNQRFYLATFFTNSQQRKGFEGFGIPDKNANIFGTTAGINIGSNIKMQVSFTTGKDNLDSKTMAYVYEDVYSEGSMVSFWGQANLLNNHVTLLGEYSHSNFGKSDSLDTLEKKSDQAWRSKLDFNYSIVSAYLDYKKIGSDFNSIANVFFQNDTEGLESNVMVNWSSFSLTCAYINSKSYLNSPIQPMLHTKNLSTDFYWLIANRFKLGGRVGKDNLDYDQSTGLPMGSEDMNTLSYSGSLGYIAGNNGITIDIGKKESLNYSADISAQVSISLMHPGFFSLNPVLGYEKTTSHLDQSNSTRYLLRLFAELHLISNILTITTDGSYTESSGDSLSYTQIYAGGNLNLFLTKLFKDKIQPVLSLKSNYQENRYSDSQISNIKIYAQADLSF
jgi:hypothetical protein